MDEKLIIARGITGSILMKSPDFDVFLKDIKEEIFELYLKLGNVVTTDPRVAELQGRLQTLIELRDRPQEWVDRAYEYKQTLKGQDESHPEDFDNG